jgi:hypothetical protein
MLTVKIILKLSPFSQLKLLGHAKNSISRQCMIIVTLDAL